MVRQAFNSPTATVWHGDALSVLKSFPAASVDCVASSSPYWMQRDNGVDPVVFGGREDCAHEWIEERYYFEGGASGNGAGFAKASPEAAQAVQGYRNKVAHRCQHCGAWRGELGQEPTPQEFAAHIAEIFSAVYRVLKPSGTCWLNIGPTFDRSSKVARGKGLALIPQRVPIALADSGWAMRSEIIWEKSNGKPDPANDRPARSHEQIWLMVKSEKYYFDPTVLREPTVAAQRKRRGDKSETRMCRDVWRIPVASDHGSQFAPFPEEVPRRCILAGCPIGGTVLDPFSGSGTTAAVAVDLGRKAIAIDLHPQAISETIERLHRG